MCIRDRDGFVLFGRSRPWGSFGSQARDSRKFRSGPVARQQHTCTEVPEKVIFMVWSAMAGELVQFACRDCRDVCRDSYENCRDCRDCILKG